MIAFLLSEVAFFSTLIVAYLTFLGRTRVGPTPREALSLPLVIGTTLCLLSSSVTIHLRRAQLQHGHQPGFRLLVGATIVLGIVVSGRHRLRMARADRQASPDDQPQSVRHDLLHAGRLSRPARHARAWSPCSSCLAWRSAAADARGTSAGVELVSWYWHFVDGVWVVVFTVVYLVGR